MHKMQLLSSVQECRKERFCVRMKTSKKKKKTYPECCYASDVKSKPHKSKTNQINKASYSINNPKKKKKPPQQIICT